MFIILVPVLTLWGLLFQSGFYAYADQHFPLSTAIPPNSIASIIPLNGFSFDRIFLTFPYFIFAHFTSNISIIEKGFLYYTFLVYSILCYAFSSIVINYYQKEITPISGFKKNSGKLIIFVLAYSNLSALNLNADGGTWSDSIILIIIAISVVLLMGKKANWKTYMTVTGMMMLSFLLDPDYIPMYWIAIFVVSFVKSVMVRNVKAVVYSVLSISLSTVSIFYLYLQSLLTGPLTLSGFSALGYRAYSSSQVAYDSSNISLYNVFILFGHIWSTIVYSPPSVLSVKNIFDLYSLYNPVQVLIVPGALFYIWLIALVSVPLFSFSSLLFRSTRRTAIQFISLFIVAYLITEEWNIPVVYNLIFRLVGLPVIGSAIGTTFSLPGHFLNLMAFAYLPLFSLGVLTIIHYSDKIHFERVKDDVGIRFIIGIEDKKRGYARRTIHAKTLVVVFIIVSLVSLSGWQAFNGSYYPMRDSPGSFLEGNAVAPKGVFTPTEINGSVIAAYNLVGTNFSEGYNTLWIGGPSVNEFTYAGPPDRVAESGLSFLTNYTYT